ncbi:hypothetical protein TREPR_0482 [Treponema primitia ZAS-2]|uniref:Uncharacterized protein n=1 Tax=Treponema primitia (strain ATCC BAA-887 / DSM 12427 / ZAS-2) TaxID=545694 RepID=F5YLF6_TREPZ|nr:hypothetical protein TREPR_0482 [Treponema primitia ZAS-2]
MEPEEEAFLEQIQESRIERKKKAAREWILLVFCLRQITE